jgi:hypothetical protein
LAAGNVPVSVLSLGTFVGFTAWLAAKRWPVGSTSWRDMKAALLTAFATPFVSIYWRLYGAIEYRVLYW